MNFQPLGFLVLFFALIIMAEILVAGALGTMYVLHQRRTFPELLLRWSAIIIPATFGYAIFNWIFAESGWQILVVFVMAAISYPVVFALHHLKHLARDAIYSHFSFESFQREAFQELVIRLSLIFLPPILLFPILQYLFIAKRINWPWFTSLFFFLQLILGVGAFFAGFRLILKLDMQRVIMLTAASAVLYLGILWFLFSQHMLY